jgi:hypothetical protein
MELLSMVQFGVSFLLKVFVSFRPKKNKDFILFYFSTVSSINFAQFQY